MVREIEVFKEPDPAAEVYGRLPKDTLLTLKGQRKDNFLSVEVELEEGTIDGWIDRRALDIKENEDQLVPDPPEVKKTPVSSSENPRKRARSRLLVPKDEGLLLRREPTFFYGLQASGAYTIIQDSSANSYYGPALSAGAHVGYHLFTNFTVHGEMAYSLLTGSTQTKTSTVDVGTNVQFGFVDSSLHARYAIENIEVFAFVQYSYGISVNNVPTVIQFNTVQDLSSIWVGGGIGYQFPLNDVVDLSVRARYGYSLLRTPVGFQTYGAGAFIQFHG